MYCKIIGCSVYKMDYNKHRCSIYVLFNNNSTHLFLINEKIFKKITGIKKLPLDFASKCNTCINSKCRIPFLECETLNILHEYYDNFCLNRRKSKRIQLNYRCSVVYKDLLNYGIINNISKCGMMIELETDTCNFSINDTIEIATNNLDTNAHIKGTNNNSIETINGTIVWLVKSKIGVRFDAPLSSEFIQKIIKKNRKNNSKSQNIQIT